MFFTLFVFIHPSLNEAAQTDQTQEAESDFFPPKSKIKTFHSREVFSCDVFFLFSLRHLKIIQLKKRFDPGAAVKSLQRYPDSQKRVNLITLNICEL